MARILKLIKMTREDSPVASVVFPIATIAFLASSFGYVALTIANH
jgi:hypothetical protein